MPSSKWNDTDWNEDLEYDEFEYAPQSPVRRHNKDEFKEIMFEEITELWNCVRQHVDERALPILQKATLFDFMQFVVKKSHTTIPANSTWRT